MSRVKVLNALPISLLTQTLSKNPLHVGERAMYTVDSSQEFSLQFDQNEQRYSLCSAKSNLSSLLDIQNIVQASGEPQNLVCLGQSEADPELWQEGPQILSTQSLELPGKQKIHFKQGDRVLYCDGVKQLKTEQAIYQVVAISPKSNPKQLFLIMLTCNKFKDGYYQKEQKQQIGEITLLSFDAQEDAQSQ